MSLAQAQPHRRAVGVLSLTCSASWCLSSACSFNMSSSLGPTTGCGCQAEAVSFAPPSLPRTAATACAEYGQR